MQRTLVELIAAKRDGQHLRTEEIRALIDAFMQGQLADYQLSAWLMAVYFRGLDEVETVALTEAMLHSGKVLDLSGIAGFKVDKHSTGGVGDKVSICLAPLVASCGVPVPMVSGRGLGHTGGTLDKLEAIPGLRTDLSGEQFVRIVGEVGTCMIGQTAEIAPADKRIYALRDVTATVESIPLIVASILSKKLAEGIDGLVLDVKVGQGAFMKDMVSAEALARSLVGIGARAGKRVLALLTDMNAPLGVAVGNASEVREAIEVLHGGGPADVVACTLALGAEMLMMAGRAPDDTSARAALVRAVESGEALRTLERLVSAQGGDARVVADPTRLALAAEEATVVAERAGTVTAVDAYEVGLVAVSIGAGRTRADQSIDPAVGIDLLAKSGTKVRAGDPLARMHVRTKRDADRALGRLRAAFTIAEAAPSAPSPLVLGCIEA